MTTPQLRERRRPHRLAAVSLVLGLAALASAPLRARAASQQPLVYAVVVGHNDGWGVLPQLRYADDDALRFYRLAVRLAPAKNVALLTELDVQTWRRLQVSGTPPPPYLPPTKKRLRQVLDLFKRQIAAARARDPKRPVHLYFFYSGHGEKGYFLLKKKGKKAAEGAFTGRDLKNAFADSQATLNGLFIDACKSQSLFVAKGPSDPELGPDFSGLIKKVEHAAKQAPIGVLTSTMSDRPAGEARDIGGGYFSHVLISGLAGAADADSDGFVRYGELAAFVSLNTRRISGQQPWFRPPRGKLRAPLVRLTGRKDVLELPPGIGGHFAIFDAKTGTLRLEVHKTAAQWTRLILEPGAYKVVWVRSRSVGLEAKVKLAGTGATKLLASRFSGQISLANLGLQQKGSGHPTTEITADQRISAFDPQASGFDQAFSPRVVEMLQVAYSSGLASARPVFSRKRGEAGPPKHELGLAYGLLGAPASAFEPAHGVALSYARRIGAGRGDVFVGGRALYVSSSHVEERANNAGRPYEMHRLILQAEGEYRLGLGSRFALGAGLYAGWQLVMLLRQGEVGQEGELISTLVGDSKAFRGGATVSAHVRAWDQLWISISGSYGFELVHREGKGGALSTEVYGRPQLLAGAGYAF